MFCKIDSNQSLYALLPNNGSMQDFKGALDLAHFDIGDLITMAEGDLDFR